MVTINVQLPEDVVDDGEGTPTPAARARAIEAAIEAITQYGTSIYLDGEDNDPAVVDVMACDGGPDGLDEVWCE
jgi:hypothetical protein